MKDPRVEKLAEVLVGYCTSVQPGGKVVRATASKNEEYLLMMLDTDEGA
jgi:leucyl aminopeptidase (aminopeptidase T)